MAFCGSCKTTFESVLQKAYKGMDSFESEGHKSRERKINTTEILQQYLQHLNQNPIK